MSPHTQNRMKLDSRLLPLVFDTIPHGIITVNRNLEITSINQHGLRMLGISMEQAIGKRCSDVLHGDQCKENCPLQLSMGEGKPMVSRSTFIRTALGMKIPVTISAQALESPTGKLLGGVEMFQDLSREYHLEKELHRSYRFHDILSKNPRMLEILDLLPQVAASGSNVLITGQSGTGKELIARAIHNGGPRSEMPFIPVNCAAIPATLLESELFGYKQGAFTDARRDKPGRIAQAEGGTLFLDEIGDMDFVLQAKLLRFLEERVYEPLGSVQAIPADVRIITATNKDLEAMVASKDFREDLFYRLNVMQIHLPRLNRRSEDIPLLTNHFIHKFAQRTGKEITGITDSAIGCLARHPFPGNVRELENIIERAFILCNNDTIDLHDLPESIIEVCGNNELPIDIAPLRPNTDSEVHRIQQALTRNQGNRTHAAKELGIHRVTLVRKLKKYGLSDL